MLRLPVGTDKPDVVAAILLPRSWAYLSAALGFLLYGSVLELTYFGIVRSYQ